MALTEEQDRKYRAMGSTVAKKAMQQWGSGWTFLSDEQRDAFCAAGVLQLADQQDESITWSHHVILKIHAGACETWRSGGSAP